MMILTEGMNLEDVPAVVDRMGAEAETVDRAAESPEMAVRMVVGQADGDRIHGDQAVVAQADLVQWDLQDHGDHRDFPDTRGPRVRQEPPGRPVPKGRQERLLRQYMHNTEIAVTMRLSTILKTIKQPL